MKPKVETKETGMFFRSFPIDKVERQEGEEGARTYDITFSSESPVERWFGYEVLSHDQGAIRMDWLNSGRAPVLLDHDHRSTDSHVGVVMKGGRRDGVGVASIRLASDGVSSRADETAKKIEDGILRSISVGYLVHEIEETKESIDDRSVWRATDWEPLEISLVTIPADKSAGIRSDKTCNLRMRHLDMNEDIDNTITETPQVRVEDPQPEMPVIDLEAELKRAFEEDTERVENIQAIAQRHRGNDDIQKLADKAIVSRMPLGDFQGALIPMLETKGGTIDAGSEVSNFVNMDNGEVSRYSMIRAFEATFDNNWKGAEFELECSDYIAERVGRPPRGVYVPLEILAKNARAMQIERHKNMVAMGLAHRAPPMDTTENVHLVGTEHLASQFIDALRPLTVTIQAGARPITGLVQNVSIPKLATSTPFEWLTEDQDATDVEPTTDAVTMDPKTIAASVPYTRKLRQQSLPSIDAILMNDLTLGAAIGIDYGVINGTGAGAEMTGILNQTGVSTVDISDSSGPTWANMVEFETDVLEANAGGASMVYMTNVANMGTLKTTEKSSGYPVFLSENGVVNGYPHLATNQMPSGTPGYLFGDFTQALIGFWGTLDILMDWATKAKSGGMVMRVFQDADTAVRHGVAFSKANQVA